MSGSAADSDWKEKYTCDILLLDRSLMICFGLIKNGQTTI